ncbi:hypothetical protein VDGD_20756 [Verticillium dahliae]|nr:hypothetical protein VDGD_20756 [Verticillium dahliae]
MGMKESGGDTIVLLRPAVALPPLTRKAKAKKATNPPDAKPRACSEEIHNPSRKERSTPQQQLPPQPPSPRPNRRGRPPKTSLTQQKQHSVSKAVAPRLADKRRASASFIDSSLSATDYSPSNSDKKTLLRARNREAAHKCRVRKQRGIEDLQTQEASLEGVNQCLKDQYTDLRDEVLLLKDMILQHGSCGCSFIESYIEDAAANISQNPDAFTTSHHLVSNSAISPTGRWFPTTPHGSCFSGFAPLEEEAGKSVRFGWNMVGGNLDFPGRVDKEGKTTTHYESCQELGREPHGF